MTPERLDLLVIEDNPDDVELMRRAVGRVPMDLKVQFVGDGLQALELLHGKHTSPRWSVPRLIILDLKLPKLDGHEILRRIRANPRTRAVPVVVLTSSQQESDIQSCYQAGANSYMVKPVHFTRFATSVETLATYWLTMNQAPL